MRRDVGEQPCEGPPRAGRENFPTEARAFSRAVRRRAPTRTKEEEARMRDDVDGTSFLLHSARQLGSSLDPPVIAARAAALAVPVLSDRCVVDVADDRGGLVPTAEAHADSDRRVVVRRPSRGPAEPE